MTNMPSVTRQREIENVIEATRDDVGQGIVLEFKKGNYYLNKLTPVPHGTKYRVYCVELTKEWVKFFGGRVVERHTYKTKYGEKPVEREALGDNDREKWELSPFDNKPADPWQLQFLVPFEDIVTGDFCLGAASAVCLLGAEQQLAVVRIAWTRCRGNPP